MKLRSLSVNQFKKFTTPHQLDGIGDELNLFVGPNEFGKSTLLDALKAVLFERYGSKAQSIKDLQNDQSGAAPQVELVFEVDGEKYVLNKRFLQQEHVRLLRPDGVLLESDAAEAELRRLLKFETAGNRGASEETLGMWGVLWVQQGQSFGRPELKDLARQSLTDAVQAEIGGLLGGQRGRALPGVFEAQLADMVSPERRQPRKRYKDALSEKDDLESTLDDLQEQRHNLTDRMDRLNDNEEQLKNLLADDRDQQDQEALAAARAEHSQAEQHASKLDAAQSQLETRLTLLANARDAKDQRATSQAELVKEQQELQQRQNELAEKQEHEAVAREPLEGLQQALELAEAATELAEQHEVDCRRLEVDVVQNEELRILRQRQANIQVAQDKLAAAQSAVAETKMDEAMLRQIRDASRDLDTANTQLSAAATKISFVFAVDRLDGVAVNGEPVTDPHAVVETAELTTISIPDRGRILVDPQVVDGADMRQAQDEARAAFEATMAEAGVYSLAEAEDLGEQRRGLEAELGVVEREVGLLGAWSEADADRIDTLVAWQQALTPERATAASVHDRTEAVERLRAAQKSTITRREEERQAREVLDASEESVRGLESEVQSLLGAFNQASEQFARRQGELRANVANRSDETLTREVQAAEAAVAAQQNQLAMLQADQPSATLEQLKDHIEQIETDIASRADQRKSLEIEIAGLKGQIVEQGGVGLDGSIAECERKLDHARIEVAALEREVAVLDLLLETLEDAEREAKERYLEPIVDRIQPYLRMLFDGAQATLANDFKIEGIVRQEGHLEQFDRLSMGTQEQIAVLVRLAFAEALVEQGAPAAVILDDALVFSDDQRMQVMFDILAHAAKRVQIIVFTCREELFESLEAHQLQLQPGDPDSLRSA